MLYTETVREMLVTLTRADEREILVLIGRAVAEERDGERILKEGGHGAVD